MSQKMKHLIIASAAVLTIGGGSSVMVATSAQATNNGHGGGHHWQDNKPNDIWRILQFATKNFNELKQGGPLLHEHSSLATAYLKAELLAQPDLAAAKAAVDANSQLLAHTVDRLYPGSHDEFLNLWRQHVQFSVDYLNASKVNDTAAKDEAKQKLQDVNNKIGVLLDNISDKLNRAQFTQQLQAHSDGTLVTIDAMIAGDWAKVYAESHKSYEDMTELSISLLMGAKLNKH